jgi:selenocysteine-specific elongation factor
VTARQRGDVVSETLHAIIGTAGHIDHGKTALVKALTGCDTDRLKEEKERGISIDLGFAALMVGDRRVGIVDVPGHERFIRNMLAGAHGIDLALLTVAADDGVMPQTEEHLDIVHLLGVDRGIVALTKADLASAERLRAVRDEIAILVAGTRLERAPVIAVSSVTGAGLEELKAEIARQLGSIDAEHSTGRFRLPVDRAFVLKGHGVVVTGTAVGGTIAAGREVHVLPGGARARVRSVENHGAAVPVAGSRQRVALNLVGVEHAEITRGDVVADLDVTLVSTRFDARVEMRPAAGKGIRTHSRVRVHAGTAEALARIVLLDGRALLAPKAYAYAQLVVEQPLVVARGDRFIVRAENARATLGGGEVVVPCAERHRRGDPTVLAALDTIRTGDLHDAVAAVIELSADIATAPAEIAERLNREEQDVRAVVDRHDPTALVVIGEAGAGELWTTAPRWDALRSALLASVARFHHTRPLEPGIEMEEVRTQLPRPVTARTFRTVVERLIGEGVLARSESLLAAPSHRVELGADAALAATIEAALVEAGYTPPDLATLERTHAVTRRRLQDVLGVLEKRGRVVRVGDGLYYATVVVARARGVLEEALCARDVITAAEYRDRLDVSRKFSIALLDYFDRSGVTLRVGDARKLRRAERAP